MERHQPGQMEQLVEVKADGLEVVLQPGAQSANRHSCLKGMVILAKGMGLFLVALMVMATLHYFIFKPSCNQNALPLNGGATTCRLKKRGEQGAYDVFTANKSATYLIHGWVNLQNITHEDIVLKQTEANAQGDKGPTLQKVNGNKPEVFFHVRVRLAENFRISLHFKSPYKDSVFLVYQMGPD